MMKAIRITKENRNQVAEQYHLDEGFLDYSSGLYLVAAFGHRMYEGLLSKKVFNETFEVGKDLENGYVEISLKPTELFLEAEV